MNESTVTRSTQPQEAFGRNWMPQPAEVEPPRWTNRHRGLFGVGSVLIAAALGVLIGRLFL